MRSSLCLFQLSISSLDGQYLIFLSVCCYEGRSKSSWTQLITSSRNFVEVRWRYLFRSTSLCKRCTSYNTLPTSRKRAADRWPLWNLLPRSSLFTVGNSQKSHGVRSGLYGGFSNGVKLTHFFQAEHRIQFKSRHHAISGPFEPGKESSEVRNLEVINGLRHVFEKWVERCKKSMAYQGRYFEKETVAATPQSSESEVIRRVHELFKRSSYILFWFSRVLHIIRR
jgi:hypothetical protein